MENVKVQVPPNFIGEVEEGNSWIDEAMKVILVTGEPSKYTQADISSARRLYNEWFRFRQDSVDFWGFLDEETRKGFRDSDSSSGNFNIVHSEE